MKRTITALALARDAASCSPSVALAKEGARSAGASDAAAVATRPIRRKERRSSWHISMPRHECGGIQQSPEDILIDPGGLGGLADGGGKRLGLAGLRW